MPKIPLSASDYDTLTEVCVFLTRCKSYSFEDSNIDEDSAHIAIDKLIDGTEFYTHEEKRAILAAIVLSLRALNGEAQLFDGIPRKDIAKLEAFKPNLEQLLPVYMAASHGSMRRK